LKKKEIDDILSIKLITEIEAKDEEKFLKQFKEKYGITKKDISDKDLKNEIKKHDFNEHEIMKLILKKLNYLNKED